MAADDGLMSPEEYRSALDELGFTQVGFAECVGATGRTGQKWALGEARVPGSVAVLLRLLRRYPRLIADVKALALTETRARKERKPKGRRKL